MPNRRHNRASSRLAASWSAARAAYRAANAASRHTIGALFKLIVLAYFIFCAAFLSLRYLVLPQIGSYKPLVERMVSRALGNNVSIATIEASWHGLQPHLALNDVVIHDRAGSDALRLPKVAATVSWWTVVTGELRLHSLELSRPELEIVRLADGSIYVGGIFIDSRHSGNDKGLEWLLAQREILIRDGRISWNDQQRKATPLVLTDVNFVLNNHWRKHRFALRATPPAALAAPLDVRAAFEHPHFASNKADFSMWKGELYASVADTDLAAWKAYVDYPIELQRGKGTVRGWLTFDRSRVADFTADMSLANVGARLRWDLEPLNLARVSGRVSVQEDFNARSDDGTLFPGGHAVALTGFSFETEDGLVLPSTTIGERYSPAFNGQPEKTELTAKLVDLRTISDFASRLPLPPTARRALADLAPRGVLQDFYVQWHGAYPEISAYTLRGRFKALSINPQPARPRSAGSPGQAAVPEIPGFENLSGSVDASERGGTLTLDSERAVLHLPGYFADPTMPFDRLAMQAKWALQPNDQLQLDVQHMNFARGMLSGSFSGKHLMPLNRGHDKLQGVLDLTGRINGLELQRVGEYLPLKTSTELRSWLTGALVGGVAEDVKIRVKGDLAQFPFHPVRAGDKPKGEFSVSGKIVKGKLNYAPDKFGKDGKSPLWPAIEEIDGNIVFDRTRMEIKADSARTSGVALSNTKAVIADLSRRDLLLAIDGEAAGALQDFLRFSNDSPVADMIDHFTEESRASGNAKLSLKLQLPLERLPDSRVQGSLQFINNNVTLQNVMPAILSASGKLDFNEKGFSLNGIRGNFLGGPVVISGGTQRDGVIQVKADGSLSADGLRKTYQSATMQAALQRVSGATRYSTTVRVRNKRPEVTVESSLQGVSLDFPAPLSKTVGETMPLKFELLQAPSGDAQILRDEVRLSVGSAVAARYERQKGTSGANGANNTSGAAAWRVVRGGIGVNAPAPQPDSGVVLNLSVNSLDLDAWRNALSVREAPVAAVGQGQAESQPEIGLGIAQYIDPDVLAARADELIVMGKKLDNVVVGASQQKDVWQANIDSKQASGYLTWSEPRNGRGNGKLTARLTSLIIPTSTATEVTELLEGKHSNAQMPALDIVAERFELLDKKFGSLELVADNARGSAGREWRISKLAITNPDGQLTASGNWSVTNGQNLSSLNYHLAVRDAGRLLDRFGFPNVIRGGKGKMEGEVSWKGLPYSLDVPSLSGRLQIDIASGQFLKVDPAAAKLLGVLSLQQLPRRLALDFSDVFSEGFAFDGVTAAATISNGQVMTDNFKMRGPAATVLIDGTADIAKESQNLHVVVIPEINVGAASVVYGLAVNPVIGVGSFLAQLFLREPLMRAFTFEYEVTGPWREPVVTKLIRKPAAPPPTGQAGRHPASIG